MAVIVEEEHHLNVSAMSVFFDLGENHLLKFIRSRIGGLKNVRYFHCDLIPVSGLMKNGEPSNSSSENILPVTG
jgi:hypothetical protein